MTQHLKIDFVSDIACPWCVIGLRGLQDALARVSELVQADVIFQPFELNPNMPPEGQNVAEHVAEKFGSSLKESEAARTMIQARAAEVGFDFKISETSRDVQHLRCPPPAVLGECDGAATTVKARAVQGEFH